MKRLIIGASLLLLGTFAIGLYLLENEVEHLQRRLADLDRELLQEQESVQVLKAEWSYLNQPERLQKLALKYVGRVGLKPIDPEQTGTLRDLPVKDEEHGSNGEIGDDAVPRPAFKPAPPPGVLMASTRSKR